ncbi:MAG: hypothetical protein ACE5HQ_00010 [Gemmatimonadota bacterium]
MHSEQSVDKLAAGAELDRLLHTEVLGGSEADDKIPLYSSELEAARALERAFLYLNVSGRRGAYTAFASLSADSSGSLVFAESSAETPALALARAALKAVRQTVSHGA